DGRVFSFTFNFSDNTAGQASKQVNILNNPVTLDIPSTLTIAKYVAQDESSITIDLKEYVSDVETVPEDMTYAAVVAPAGLFLTSIGDGVYTITAVPGFVGSGVFTATADDTDGSTATDAAQVVVTVDFIPEAPVAVAGPDQRVHEGDVVSVDGSASYDPDGGSIVLYEWDFGNGDTATGAHASVVYDDEGAYTVTLTVTDDEGDQDTDTLSVTVDEPPYVPQCSDGKDNDHDGLIDMDDPGCSDPYDPTEYNFGSSGAEYGIDVVSVSTYGYEGYERAVPGDVIVVEVVLKNTIGSTIEDLRVGFSVPELGVKQKSSLFDVKPGQRVTRSITVYLPYDAIPGEYYTEITVSNGDLRRSLHRSLEVVDE
ncbi:PKD domain-containing protein, partial [Candidatus Woesearchaeota archaeon]|nr:PKD domain-containing protein [Candidatus Woesearchaeota archaeon]